MYKCSDFEWKTLTFGKYCQTCLKKLLSKWPDEVYTKIFFREKKHKNTICFRLSAKKHQTLTEFFWQGCQICNLRVQTNLRRTKNQFNKHLNLIIFFGFWNIFSNFYQIPIRRCCQKATFVSRRRFWWNDKPWEDKSNMNSFSEFERTFFWDLA